MEISVKNFDVTKVTIRWDRDGYYCETWNLNIFCDDSQKVWFPVPVEDYKKHQLRELKIALGSVFPNADLVVLN